MKNIIKISIMLILLQVLYLYSEETQSKNNFNIEEFEKSYKFHTNLELYEILTESSIKYSMELGDSTTFTDILGEKSVDYVSNPYLILDNSEEGITTLAISEPQDEVLDLFLEAAQLIENGKYNSLIEVYQEALDLDNSYFKTWTNLGDSFYLNGEYEKAITYFQKAIELNEIGYQEYWFLADTYLKLGEIDKALENITIAFMLNPHNSNMIRSLNEILNLSNHYLRGNRTRFPYEVEKQNEQECKLTFDENNGLNWIPMAQVTGIWMMEKEFVDINQHYNEQDILNQIIIQEMLITQAYFIATKIQENNEVSDQESYIYDVVNEGYLSEYILWEIIERKNPSIILLIPKDERKRVLEYISKFVICEVEMK